MVPYFDGEGAISGVIDGWIDITDRKRSEEEKAKLEAKLLQAQKLETIGQLAGGVDCTLGIR